MDIIERGGQRWLHGWLFGDPIPKKDKGVPHNDRPEGGYKESYGKHEGHSKKGCSCKLGETNRWMLAVSQT